MFFLVIILIIQVSAKNHSPSTSFERAVPPRTPIQRLTMLKKFSKDWSAKFLGSNCTVCARNHPRAFKFMHKLELQYGRFLLAYKSSCGFFDPSIAHGGPNPYPKIRDRREVILLGDDDMDIFDDVLMRVSTDPLYALRQIFVGFRKWTERYISDCYGERVHKYHSRRLTVILIQLKLLIKVKYM